MLLPKPTHHNWTASPLSDLMQQAMIQISGNIELCVEVGGNPKNPPLLLVMGLGSQLVFWPNSFILRLINAGFYVIRFDNRDIGLSSKIKPPKVQFPETPPDQLETPKNANEPVNRLSLIKMRFAKYKPLKKTSKQKLKPIPAMLRMQVGLDNSKYTTAYDLTHLADDTASLIQALGFTQVNILGASMGGIVSQILAAKYPHLINRLALLFSTNNRAFLPPPKPKQLYTLLKRPASYEEEDIVEHGKWFINQVGSQGHINEQQVAKLSRLRYHRCFYPAGSVQQLDAILVTGSISHYSKEIKAPTLVMHGSKDGLVPISHGAELASIIPNATFKCIKGMGHDLPDYFQPYIVAQIKKHMLS